MNINDKDLEADEEKVPVLKPFNLTLQVRQRLSPLEATHLEDDLKMLEDVYSELFREAKHISFQRFKTKWRSVRGDERWGSVERSRCKHW